MKETSFIAAAQAFFGRKSGQSLGDFTAEVKKLTPQDREDMIPGLEANLGVKIVR